MRSRPAAAGPVLGPVRLQQNVLMHYAANGSWADSLDYLTFIMKQIERKKNIMNLISIYAPTAVSQHPVFNHKNIGIYSHLFIYAGISPLNMYFIHITHRSTAAAVAYMAIGWQMGRYEDRYGLLLNAR